MLVIRFSRVGKKSHAQYKVVLAEKTYPVKGKFVEILGSYDPHLKKAVLKEERIKHWLSQGVTCSDTAYNLLVKNGLIEGAKRKVKLPEKPAPAAPEDSAEPVKEVAEENPAGEKAEPKAEAKPEETSPAPETPAESK